MRLRGKAFDLGFFLNPRPFTTLKQTPRASQRAFTLVEVLVATSVLTLMVLMMTALMNSASIIVMSGNRHLAADDQARQVFDRMQVDFARMLKRNDVYVNFSKPSGNDWFSFYAETPGYFSGVSTGSVTSAQESNSSLVSYQIPLSSQLTSTTQSLANSLCRLGQGNQWTDIAFAPSNTPTYSISNGHLLSNAIFRMESAFIYRAGDTKLQISATPPAPGTGFQNLEAIIVALGVLDADSQKLVPASAYATLVSALPDYTTATAATSVDLTSSAAQSAAAIDPILAGWRSAINSPTFAQTAGIPAAAARQVRVYQRIIYLQ
jgi:prepilin-type N-terminal cleavage/methylation domain-containing protein